jgi:glycosyltransferase involved in cell wall biosynthesis
MSRIAVLMPVFNEEHTIRKSLTSVVEQSKRPTIVLIGDNESTDTTASTAKEILEKSGIDYRILKVRRYPELGKLNINNVLYELSKYMIKEITASFDYIAVIEADVVLERRYFEKLTKIFEICKKLCIAGGILKPFGLPKEPFPLTRIKANLWGCNRVYRAECWFKLNNKYDIRLLPAWDTDHVVLALHEGYHVYPVKNATSVTLRGINLFKGYPKGFTDALHGLPIWWALYKTLQHKDLKYLASYTASRITRKELAEKISLLRAVYKYSAYRVLLSKVLSSKPPT